jgi:predicted porin
MKKSLLALAVLGAYAGVASAQSSVTIFGVVDLSINNIKNGDLRTTSMQSNQLNSNRLGFRGFEDLGGGLGAGFWIEGAMSNENGQAAGQTWQRRSTVSLISQAAGEIRLGRDYVPSFWNRVFFDVYGANGLGNDTNLISLANPANSGAGTGVRANNSVGYFLPGNLGGLYGQAMYALGQGNDNNKYWGGRLGFAAGPFDVAGAYGETDTVFPDKLKDMNIGGSWNFGFMKLMALWNELKFSSLKEDYWGIGASFPIGQGELRAQYGQVDNKGTLNGVNTDNNDAKIFSVQYIYNLSKRTALYGGYAKISNDGVSARSVLPGTIGSTGNVGSTPGGSRLAGGDSDGWNLGVRHSF